MAIEVKVIWVKRKSKYFCKGGWTRTLETHVTDLPVGQFGGRTPSSIARVFVGVARQN
jgi:hypothetical protein